MKNLNKIIYIILAFFLFQGKLISQGLDIQPLNCITLSKDAPVKSNRNVDSLNTPFFEDFSYQTSRPDEQLWLDRSVFVNSTLAVRPPGYGVATLDGTDASGNPYQAINTSGAADTLTSKPFRWNVLPSDSVYMSFYVQPGGLGNFPEFIDSLILEFYNPTDSLWQRVWGTKGEDYPQALREFKLVMLPIIDTSYLQRGFQFRFRNFAQLNGSWDHWHLDYIRLNSGRFKTDTLMNDVGFMHQPSSLIDFYQSAPMWHFQSNAIDNMLEFFNLSLTSLRLGAVGIDYGFNYFNASGEKVDSVTSDPQGPVQYRSEYVMNEAVKYVYADPGTESTHFDLEYFITNNTNDEAKRNDTVRFQQVFSNYYALDDGSAEARVNLNNGSGGFVAQRFESWVSDTLKAIQIHFNRTTLSGGSPSFYLMIWAAGSNQPGSLLWQQEVAYPDPDGLNGFSTFALDVPLPIPAGTYYIGWAQTNNAELNIGFDRNLNNNERIYYNLDGNWNVYAAAEGTLMIRPVFRYPFDIFVGMPSIAISNLETLHVYPNPANNFVRLYDVFFANWILFDLQGRPVNRGTTSNGTIELGEISSGIYGLGIWGPNKQFRTTKFCVQRDEK
jgi:hypothetical protein